MAVGPIPPAPGIPYGDRRGGTRISNAKEPKVVEGKRGGINVLHPGMGSRGGKERLLSEKVIEESHRAIQEHKEKKQRGE